MRALSPSYFCVSLAWCVRIILVALTMFSTKLGCYHQFDLFSCLSVVLLSSTSFRFAFFFRLFLFLSVLTHHFTFQLTLELSLFRNFARQSLTWLWQSFCLVEFHQKIHITLVMEEWCWWWLCHWCAVTLLLLNLTYLSKEAKNLISIFSTNEMNCYPTTCASCIFRASISWQSYSALTARQKHWHFLFLISRCSDPSECRTFPPRFRLNFGSFSLFSFIVFFLVFRISLFFFVSQKAERPIPSFREQSRYNETQNGLNHSLWRLAECTARVYWNIFRDSRNDEQEHDIFKLKYWTIQT